MDFSSAFHIFFFCNMKLQVARLAVASFFLLRHQIISHQRTAPPLPVCSALSPFKIPPLYFPPSTHLVCVFDPIHFLSYSFKEPNIIAITSEDEVLTFHRIDVSSGLRCHACQQLVWQSRSVQFSYGMLLPLSSLALVLILWHI